LTGCGRQLKRKRSGETTAAVSKPMPVYYDFDDVLIPRELKVLHKDSFIYLTSGMTAGVLTLKGRVNPNSLIAFFENNMAKDNWAKVSAFKSERSILLFQKPTRTCVMLINEKSWNTHVEIWVSPTASGISGGLLKE
jgi:hypothetical protein